MNEIEAKEFDKELETYIKEIKACFPSGLLTVGDLEHALKDIAGWTEEKLAEMKRET
jgi:hypothetical protein